MCGSFSALCLRVTPQHWVLFEYFFFNKQHLWIIFSSQFVGLGFGLCLLSMPCIPLSSFSTFSVQHLGNRGGGGFLRTSHPQSVPILGGGGGGPGPPIRVDRIASIRALAPRLGSLAPCRPRPHALRSWAYDEPRCEVTHCRSCLAASSGLFTQCWLVIPNGQDISGTFVLEAWGAGGASVGTIDVQLGWRMCPCPPQQP